MLEKDYYKGKKDRCFILATGPSLSEVDLSLLENEITIGVSTIQKSGFVPDYVVISDPTMVEEYPDWVFTGKEKIKHYIMGYLPGFPLGPNTKQRIEKFGNTTEVPSREKTNEEVLPLLERTVEVCRRNYYIDSDLNQFSVHGGSVVQDLAVPTAVHLGFKEIYLVGVDGGWRHFYANHPDGEDRRMDKWLGQYGEQRPGHNFIVVKEVLNEMGIEIYNSSPSNRFEELEYKELNKVIGE